MDILDIHEELKNLKFNGLTLNLDERYPPHHLTLPEFNWRWLYSDFNLLGNSRNSSSGARSKVTPLP